MNINWYPGHMKKSLDRIKSDLKLVDLCCIVLDARIPYASFNPILDAVLEDKPRMYLLNKKDLAEEHENDLWLQYLSKKHPALLIDARDNRVVQSIEKQAKIELKERWDYFAQKNITRKSVRLMLCGIPNCGKSTLINTIAGRSGAKVGNTPGVTRQNQWIKRDGIELLDTPGVLWPKFEDDHVGYSLSFVQSIKDEILDTESLTLKLIETLEKVSPQALNNRYDVETKGKTALQIMQDVALKRGFIMKRGEIDYTRVANSILDEFRKGMLGRITLEKVEEIKDVYNIEERF